MAFIYFYLTALIITYILHHANHNDEQPEGLTQPFIMRTHADCEKPVELLHPKTFNSSLPQTVGFQVIFAECCSTYWLLLNMDI